VETSTAFEFVVPWSMARMAVVMVAPVSGIGGGAAKGRSCRARREI
jgi:hypothetical protein